MKLFNRRPIIEIKFEASSGAIQIITPEDIKTAVESAIDAQIKSSEAFYKRHTEA